MSPSIGEVRHDLAALSRFIDSIALDYVREENFPSYLKASKRFLIYIDDLARATNSYLSQFLSALDPALPLADPELFYDQTKVVRTLRLAWFQLHELIKPALDADTLHVPYWFMNSLTARFRQLPGFHDVDFAVLHATELNYFQIGANYIRTLAANIRSIVPGAPEFPLNLGIIALPYSQSSSLFLNAALAHEMGHFAFQERNEAAFLSRLVVTEVQNAATSPLSRLDLAWCQGRILDWCQEIYCDLFALWLIGPSFSFSFIELFAYTRLAPIITHGTTLPPIASESRFSDGHPASAFRLGEHVRFLQRRKLGWWDQIKNGTSHYIALLADAAALKEKDFSFGSQFRPGLEATALKAFFSTVGNVSTRVEEAFRNVSAEVDTFDDQQELIKKYLSYGVVPSRLVSNGKVVTPSPVALINAAHLFTLQELDKLIDRIEGAKPDCLECRARWSQRVEMWTGKALEDVSG